MPVWVRIPPVVHWEGDREFHFLSNLYIGGFNYLTLLQVTLSTHEEHDYRPVRNIGLTKEWESFELGNPPILILDP